MANKTLDQQFSKDWEKAVAWAQSQGVSTNAIRSVFNFDSQRVANGDFPLSIAERNHALLTAQNPNKVTQVPSDKPSPKSFLGNVRSNLANIFTGLAPNHLIPNIAHQAETAIMHPSSWLHPLEQVAGGVTQGNLSEVKTGLEAAGGQNSILSWIPGVYDLGQLAKGGIDALATQPITAFLDVAPFAPAGRIASLAADDARIGTMASKLGMTTEEFKKASIPQMGMAWTLMRPLTKFAGEGKDLEIVHSFPGAGLLTRGQMRDIKGNPITVAGALSNWSQKLGGLSKAAAGIGAASVQAQILGTDAEMYAVAPYAQLMKNIGQDGQKQVQDLINDPTKTRAQVEGDDSIDQGVRDAYSAGKDMLGYLSAETMASGEVAMVRGPMGHTEAFVSSGESHNVAQAGFALRSEMVDAIKELGPANYMFNQMQEMDARSGQFMQIIEQSRKKGLQAPIEGHTQPVAADLTRSGKPKRPVSLELSRQRDVLLSDHGVVAGISEALSGFTEDGTPKPVDNETALHLTRAAISRLQHEGYGMVPHTVDQSLTELYTYLNGLKSHLEKRISTERRFTERLLGMREVKGFKKDTSRVASALRKLAAAKHTFDNLWWKYPSDAWRSVAYDGMTERLVSMMGRKETVGDMTQALKDTGYSDKQIAQMQSDPKIMAEALYNETLLASSNPHGTPILSPEEMQQVYDSGVDHVNTLRMQGHDVQWVPVVSTRDIERYNPGHYGIKPGLRERRLSTTLPRNMHEFTPQRYDLLASIHLTTKEVIEHNNAIEFVMNQLMPHAKGAGEVYDWAQKAFPDRYVSRNAAVQTATDVLESDLERLGLVEWDPVKKVGVSAPRFAKEKMYLPKSIADATDSLIKHNGFPMDGLYDKATNLFRFSILGLSPRFTAHIVFGGAFLLALRSDPRIVTKMLDAYRMSKDPTHLPVAMRQVSAERGVQPAEYHTLALTELNKRGATQLGHMQVQEDLAKQGIDWRNANPVQWLKAVGEVNYRFTRRVSTMYRAAAMLDYAAKATERGFYEERDPVTGEVTRYAMTAERAQEEGVQHALRVMGDLQHMSPLERASFMRIMPFYGWTRHILHYVLTYPVDHPYRASFLAVQATMDSDEVARSLSTRIQFLFNIGSPDPMGNVHAVDLRFLDPLRDTANYASLSGWIGALNPVLTAPLAAIDPNLVYANTSLYPNVTYNQLYGIETSAPQGNPLTAVAQQFVPQIGALDAAYQTATDFRSNATRNPKAIFQALNIPFAQVQDINLKQLAAKGEDARFNVAKTAAANAWKQPGMGGHGIEKALAGYGSVPNPLNIDAGDITPAQLQQIYNAALAAYPGQNPADVVTAPPNAPGY